LYGQRTPELKLKLKLKHHKRKYEYMAFLLKLLFEVFFYQELWNSWIVTDVTYEESNKGDDLYNIKLNM
jgi:hypothetical protein